MTDFAIAGFDMAAFVAATLAEDLGEGWPGGGRDFAAGERIHTENSYKHPLPAFAALLREAGFARSQSWTDARGWYAMVHARA